MAAHMHVQGMGPQGPPHDQQALAGKIMLPSGQRHHGGAHGVARQYRPGSVEALGPRQGQADAPGKASQNPVAHAGDGVLLMQHRGHTGQTGRQHGREGGITAKTGHHLGPEAPDDAPGPADGTGHAPGSGKGPQATPQKAAHRQADEVDARRPGQTLFRAVLRAHEQQFHTGMALTQGFRHGQRREDVPAGTAGG